MDNRLERALKEALEAEESTPRRHLRSEDVLEHDLDHSSSVLLRERPEPPQWQPPRRSVGDALRTLPGGAVLKPLWIVIREVSLFVILGWLTLVAVSMWQTSPPADLLLDERGALIIAAVVALSIRLAWAVSRRVILDALTD